MKELIRELNERRERIIREIEKIKDNKNIMSFINKTISIKGEFLDSLEDYENICSEHSMEKDPYNKLLIGLKISSFLKNIKEEDKALFSLLYNLNTIEDTLSMFNKNSHILNKEEYDWGSLHEIYLDDYDKTGDICSPSSIHVSLIKNSYEVNTRMFLENGIDVVTSLSESFSLKESLAQKALIS